MPTLIILRLIIQKIGCKQEYTTHMLAETRAITPR
jgi:hypothetical protein